MTAPNAQEPSARDQGEHEHPSDVWMPTMLRPAPELTSDAGPAVAEPTVVAPGSTGVPWHRVPEPPEPPWRASNRSRMVALAGGSGGGNPQVAAELQRLREETATANERLTRQRALLDQLDRQLAEARRYATAEGIAARQAERRIAELNHELALAHEELQRLRARDLVRTDRVIGQVDDHHRSLVAALRADTARIESPGHDDADANSWYLGSAAETETETETDADVAAADVANPTLLALRHWLSPEDAMLIVDGDALAAALAPNADRQDAGADGDVIAGRSAAVAALRTGLHRQAPKSAIVFDGSLSTAAPDDVLPNPDHEPRVLVTAPGIEVTTAVDALVGGHDAGSIVLAHEAVAASGVLSASYRLGVDALAQALAGRA